MRIKIVNPTRSYVPNGSFSMPDGIEQIYIAALKFNYIVTCDKLDWMLPVGYKIGVYNNVILQLIAYNQSEHIRHPSNFVPVVDPADYEIVSYILQPGKISICPLARDSRKSL